MVKYMEARERFFRLVNDRPGDIDLISHNAAHVMLKGVDWPEGFTVEKIGVAIKAFFLEFWRRWELAPRRTDPPPARP